MLFAEDEYVEQLGCPLCLRWPRPAGLGFLLFSVRVQGTLQNLEGQRGVPPRTVHLRAKALNRKPARNPETPGKYTYL